MTRNLDRRMEVLCPVNDKNIASRVKDMLFLLASDTEKGRMMQPDGSYTRLELPDGCKNAQMVEYQRCRDDYLMQLPHRQMFLTQTVRRAVGGALIWLGRHIAPSVYVD